MASSVNIDEAALARFRKRATYSTLPAVQDAPQTRRHPTLSMTAFGTPRTCEACCHLEKAGHSEPCGPCGQRLDQRQAMSRRMERREAKEASKQRLVTMGIACGSGLVTLAMLVASSI